MADKCCEFCGKIYDFGEEEELFSISVISYSYNRLVKDLCADCAENALNDEIDGVYFETCENCGIEFDIVKERAKFRSRLPWFDGATLEDYWECRILCADCAIEQAKQ